MQISIKHPPFDKTKAVVYIVGGISKDPLYKEKFQKAESYLRVLGYTKIIVPTCVPDNLPYTCYAPISIAFVQACDVVYALSDWKESKGAKAEVSYALMAGKIVIEEGESYEIN